jgi:type VI secretion system protein ImpA
MDLAALLEPLGEDSPTGADLRYVDGDLTFQQIEDHRSEQDAALSVEGEGKSANWKGVVRSCEEALSTRSKDLQIVAWLCEGLAHTEGFAGVRDGLQLAKRMLETFWDQLHPGYEEGEVILPIRAKPIAWLASPRCFLPAVKSIPVATAHERPLSWADREMAERVDAAQTHSDPSDFQELTAAGAVSSETWRGALMNTPLEQLQQTLSDLRDCQTQLEELRKVCEERFGNEAPTLSPLDDVLAEIRETVERAVGGGSADEEIESEEFAQAEGAAAPRPTGPIATRKQALAQLSQVAAFFRQTEPHSPISYLVQRAVRWGDMPLEQLLKEVVKDSSTLDHIWDTLGIQGASDDED